MGYPYPGCFLATSCRSTSNTQVIIRRSLTGNRNHLFDSASELILVLFVIGCNCSRSNETRDMDTEQGEIIRDGNRR